MTEGRGASGTTSALLFFVLPVLALAAAVGLRTSGEVDSGHGVVGRLLAHVPTALDVARTEGVAADLLLAVAAAESGGHPDARSHRGAVGLMQLRPGTAADMAARGGEPAPDLGDPATSLRLGARYLALQMRRFREQPLAEELALCAYNAGPGNVSEWLQDTPLPPESDADTLAAWIRFRETRDYVRRVATWRGRWREILACAPPATESPEPGN